MRVISLNTSLSAIIRRWENRVNNPMKFAMRCMECDREIERNEKDCPQNFAYCKKPETDSVMTLVIAKKSGRIRRVYEITSPTIWCKIVIIYMRIVVIAEQKLVVIKSIWLVFLLLSFKDRKLCYCRDDQISEQCGIFWSFWHRSNILGKKNNCQTISNILYRIWWMIHYTRSRNE